MQNVAQARRQRAEQGVTRQQEWCWNEPAQVVILGQGKTCLMLGNVGNRGTGEQDIAVRVEGKVGTNIVKHVT